ncbi:4-(cytidine 5'-diphospho)-2-C-methyl-D-erythritol kinase [Belliella aquatica]|uniref:4-diphosphocytidyl-2-C-methyl-D-erythritol kinase n=1 Tax=Belliella aquatica TaxID=1323734 RepID=A0ABQ1N5D7_9BACT|nr:4-(cytidine 5'-diphospho)-2-C-methyl-D-erythritol kinase [Belliella aquatica]MCH7407063.1 4-(cytidine 5'-diphospho)-2-C-methyl-D-erythritol kinase [Belliella aquatica]GGC51564.1 4-diphosphocytidyl-2-C-methyl-D-erythritol kinase [Belliella aquatica]
MISFPNAKINLGLHITAKRKDGYHDIETCMVPIPLYDALEMILDKKTTFTNTGLEIPGSEKDNLILKALKLLRKDFNELPHLNIHLHKNIPMGAGLGGGSADAAFALSMMNNLFDLLLEDWFLEDYAAQLGSDCPFFIENTPKIATGRGEILEPVEVDLSGKHLLLINPNIHIGTKEAYAGVAPKASSIILKEVLADRSRWKDELVNDFEASIFPRYPEIASIKSHLYEMGAFYAAMSGSGSTVFGLFHEKPEKGNWKEGYFVFEGEM